MFPAHIRNTTIQTCSDHCKQTAMIAGSELKEIGLEKSSYLAGLLHDAGKFTEQFSTYITAAAKGEDVKKNVIHSFAGMYYLLSKYQCSDSAYDKLAAQLLAYAIGSHHGSFDCFTENKDNAFELRLKKQPDYDETAIRNFTSECCPETLLDDLFKSASGEITRLISIINEISEPDEIGSESYFYIGLTARLISSAVIDGDRKDTYRFMNGISAGSVETELSPWEECLVSLENYIDRFPTKTPIQIARREMSDYCKAFAANEPGIYRLNLPTGGGKTLSGMRYALAHAKQYNKNRIIYVAPFISIIEQNAAVIKEAVGNSNMVLEHHSNIIQENEAEDEINKYDLLTETWDVPIVVTTLVQLLNTMFSGKTSSIRRFHTLCESVIIIDEVQSVPTKMLSLFNLAVNYLSEVCKATVLLCSATQPCFETIQHKLRISEKNIIPEEISEKYNQLFKRTELKDAGAYRLRDIPAFAMQVISDTSSLLIVCNTKIEAQLIYDELRGQCKNCFHLSASMCMRHRKLTLEAIRESLDSGEKTVCVATQVIEAGVDISFDAVIRLSAGIDNIVQAAGRCNRNGESESRRTVYIIKCTDEKLLHLEEIQNSQNACNNLLVMYASDPQSFSNDLASDKSVEFFFRSLYNAFADNHFDYPSKENPSLYELLSCNETYRDGVNDKESYYVCQAFKTAGSLFDVIDNDSASVIVPYGEGEHIINELLSERAVYDISFTENLIKRAKEYSVSVSNHQLKQLEKSNITSCGLNGRIFMLQPEYYDSGKGLVSVITGEEGIKECSTLIL